MKRSNPFQFKHSFFLVFNGLFYKTARHLSKNTYTTELKSLQSNNSKLHTPNTYDGKYSVYGFKTLSTREDTQFYIPWFSQ